MAKKLLKVASLLMVASMLMALAACSSPAPAATSAAPAGSGTAEVAVTPAAPEPVTLKFWTAEGATGTSGVHDDPIMNEIARITGVTVDWVFNITKEQASAMIASGDLPDFLNAWIAEDNGPGLPTYLAGKNMIDMEPYLADHGKNIALDKGKVQFGKDFLSGNTGKLYFIPSWGLGLDAKPSKSFAAGTGIGLYVRWDLYKEAGYPELTGGLNDIIPILKQMQDLHPTTADGKKVYGLSPFLADWGLWNFTIYPQGLDSIFAEAGGFTDIDPHDNAIKSQILDTTSSLWQGAKFFFLANQAGVLDPDSLMQKYDQAQDKQNTGRCLMGPCNWSVAGANGTFAKNGEPEKGFMAVKLPASFTEVANGYKNPFTDRWAMGVTVKCKTPERAVDILDFVHSKDGMRLLLNGIEGTHWNVGSDGVPHLTPDILKLQLTGSAEDQQLVGFTGFTHIYGYAEGSWDSKYNCQAQFKLNEDPASQMANATPFEKDYAGHYQVAYPDQLWEKQLTDQGKIYDGSWLQMVEPTPADIKTIDDNLMNYLLVDMVQIITSADEAAFNAKQAEIIQKCKDMGAETAFNWHKTAFQTAVDKVDAFYEKINK